MIPLGYFIHCIRVCNKNVNIAILTHYLLESRIVFFFVSYGVLVLNVLYNRYNLKAQNWIKLIYVIKKKCKYLCLDSRYRIWFIMVNKTIGSFFIFLYSSICPPHIFISTFIKLSARVIKTMSKLMSNNCAKTTIV